MRIIVTLASVTPACADGDPSRDVLWAALKTCVLAKKLAGRTFPCLDMDLGDNDRPGTAVLRTSGEPTHVVVMTTDAVAGLEASVLRSARGTAYWRAALAASWREISRSTRLKPKTFGGHGGATLSPATSDTAYLTILWNGYASCKNVIVTQKPSSYGPFVTRIGSCMPRPKATTPRDAFASIRLTTEERTEMEAASARLGFSTMSEYVRYLHARMPKESTVDALSEETAQNYPAGLVRKFLTTKRGAIFHGNSLAYLHNVAPAKGVDLIMTSPPFGLVRKKSYGNEDANFYCDWFRPFAAGFKRILKDEGSLVIDIGGAWIPGQPTRSLYHFKLLVMLVEEFGFHLCQEHYWWNPSKLPTPAEWVNIRRIRVKDAVNTVWWLSPSPWPKANNRRVLAPYSESMRDLLKNGYVSKLRPSGHHISEKFSKDNGGSVPPNLLAIANTESNGSYQDYCREMKIDIHPARFPPQLPEYFIRFLTNAGDLVVDPFGGSCVTGAVAENLGRKWACCELSEEYLEGAKARFSPVTTPLPRDRSAPYMVYQPCALPMDEKSVPLIENGGRTRPPGMSRKAKIAATKGGAVEVIAAE